MVILRKLLIQRCQCQRCQIQRVDGVQVFFEPALCMSQQLTEEWIGRKKGNRLGLMG